MIKQWLFIRFLSGSNMWLWIDNTLYQQVLDTGLELGHMFVHVLHNKAEERCFTSLLTFDQSFSNLCLDSWVFVYWGQDQNSRPELWTFDFLIQLTIISCESHKPTPYTHRENYIRWHSFLNRGAASWSWYNCVVPLVDYCVTLDSSSWLYWHISWLYAAVFQADIFPW